MRKRTEYAFFLMHTRCLSPKLYNRSCGVCDFESSLRDRGIYFERFNNLKSVLLIFVEIRGYVEDI